MAVFEMLSPVESRLPTASAHEILTFMAVQGLGVGVCSTLLYGLSIRLLGSQRCSMVGALAPVLATLLAVPLLEERPTALTAAGVLVLSIGVVMAVRSAPSPSNVSGASK